MAFLPVFYLVMVLVMLLLMVALATTKRPIFFWITALVLIIWFWLPGLLYNVSFDDSAPVGTVQSATNEFLLHVKYEFALWYWIPLVAAFALFFTYLWWGGAHGDHTAAAGNDARPRWSSVNWLRRNDSSAFYVAVIWPRRSLWLVFAIVVLSTLLISTSLLIELQERIVSQHPLRHTLTVVVNAMKLHDLAIRQPDSIIHQLGQEAPLTRTQWVDVLNEVEEIGSNARNANLLSQKLYTDVVAASLTSLQSVTVSTPLDSAVLYARDLKAWLAEVAWLSGDVATAAEEIMLQKTAIMSNTVGTASLAPEGNLQASYRTMANSLAVFRYLNANISVRSTAPFVSIAILYAVFLFLPWLVYFTYLLSKRNTIARETRRDLEDFGLLGKFLDPCTPTWDHAQSIAKQLAKALEPLKDTPENWGDPHVRMAIKDAWQRATEKGENTQYHELRDLLVRCGVDSDSPPTNNCAPTKTEWTLAYNETLDVAIKMRQFYNREYLIALVLYTVVSAVGWYYIFFSGSALAMREFIADSGASSAALNVYLARNISPVTAAFLGAWLFGVLMLLHNWTNDDLNPRGFFYAATRLIIGMLVGLVLANLLPTSSANNDNAQSIANLLAFVIGIFPYSFLVIVVQEAMKWFTALVSKFAGNTANTAEARSQRISWQSRHQLDELDDVTAWDQARLDQEGFDSVHSLALANLERLVINTPYEGPLLADWVDQALLRVHAPEDLVDPLRDIGVRTASNLIAIYCPTLENSPDEDVLSFIRGKRGGDQATAGRIKSIADALRESQRCQAAAKPAPANANGPAAAPSPTPAPSETPEAHAVVPPATQPAGHPAAQPVAQPAVASTTPPAGETATDRSLEPIILNILTAMANEPNLLYTMNFWRKRRARLAREMGFPAAPNASTHPREGDHAVVRPVEDIC